MVLLESESSDSRMTAVFTTYRVPYNPILKSRLGVASILALHRRTGSRLCISQAQACATQRKVVLMEKNTQEELKAHLMATNEAFRSLAEKHAQYHKLLEQLEAKPRLTVEDEAEEQRLKKQKLRLKDQMNEIMARSRAQHVA